VLGVATPAAGRVAAEGRGDPYFPELGDRGYAVRHYDLALHADGVRLDGVATIQARSRRRLPEFQLDLVGLAASSVLVDGRPARYHQDDDELIVTPRRPLGARVGFSIVVRYGGRPVPGTVPGTALPDGWLQNPTTSITLGEPDAARRWFPVNDGPGEKATFTFRVTVPAGLDVVANGRRVARATTATTLTDTWQADRPMAPYLAEVVIGPLTEQGHPGPDGVLRRDAYDTGTEAAAAPFVAATDAMLTFFTSRFGPFPFHEYGVVVPNVRPGGFGFEAQTLSVITADVFGGAPPSPASRMAVEPILAHELTHQWFGDWVSPARWSDIWLNEGFATYGEWLWQDHALGVPLAASAAGARRELAAAVPRPVDHPGVDAMFSPIVYQRGALTLDALHRRVGDATFFRILQTYVARFGGRAATTDDFVRLAGRIGGPGVTALLRRWLAAGPLPAD
jgi:aminopeptidase N